MTLVIDPRCFHGYPLTSLPESLIDRLLNPKRGSGYAFAIRLQCFCELTGQTLVGRNDAFVLDVLNDFCAALYTPLFKDPAAREGSQNLYWLRCALPDTLQVTVPGSYRKWPTAFRRRVEAIGSLTFESEKLEFWSGWIAENSSGARSALILWRFWKRFGPERTRQYFQGIRRWKAISRDNSHPILQKFADYLVDVDTIDFEDSTSVGSTVASFMPTFFRSGQAAGIRLATLSGQWRRFAYLLTNHLLGHVWASPVPSIPMPTVRQVVGSARHVRKGAGGQTVKIALLTPVPLHLTDSQAKELLFRDIRREVDTLLLWARHEVREARERVNRRKMLAAHGIVSELPAPGTTNGIRRRVSRACPDHLAHAAATFEAHGFEHLSLGRSSALFPRPLARTAWELGIPTPALLLAHATLLTAIHPKITPVFLSELDLFDAEGRQVGLVQADAGWYLRGQKRRRGPRLAQQDVLLTEETLQVVLDVIELTAPLRRWLRAQDSKYWRRLFLATPSMGTPPIQWSPSQEAFLRAGWVAERFVQLASCLKRLPDVGNSNSILSDPAAARDLANRFTLKRLRSSAAVLIYLETGSVEEMAKALGHEAWRPQLLDHYLPRPIQEFFTERWVRLFQTGILCEALRGSPHLLEATSFVTMDELDAFLEHHAFRRIPAHLEDPDRVGGHRRSESTREQVVFGIEVGILTILMSLEAAVRTASRDPCGRAIRWARISERLIPHLEAQAEQPEFHAMVAEARRHANAGRVEALVYG